jgi:hypothetical protein
VALVTIQPCWEFQVLIEEVDGQRLRVFHKGAEVLPGNHSVRATLVIRGSPPHAIGSHALQFVAEAGHRYKVLGDYHLRGPRIWIQDEHTGQMMAVAVTKPGKLPPVGANRP